METIEKIYKIGYGPSSSHTMGPRKAADIFINQYAEAARFRVTLYGSLATTGKGHLTDKALFEIFGKEKLELIWEPIAGLVQIPCIERNAFAAARAMASCAYANLSNGKHRVSFDKTVITMKQTGNDLPSLYKETSEGGLALFCRKA